MADDQFKERAYEILYNQYKNILRGVVQKSINLENRCNNTGRLLEENREEYIKDKVALAENLGQVKDSWVKEGIVSKEDREVIRTLEYCLGEREFFRKE